MFETLLESGAEFSKDKRYRYALWRVWGPSAKRLVIIGLNPSTADETNNDPTIRRCITFADREKCDGLIMLNLFAWRSTDPTLLTHLDDPIGPKNIETIEDYTVSPDHKIVLAWGTQRVAKKQGPVVIKHLQQRGCKLYSFGLAKSGAPKHPLYLRSNTKLQRWL